MREIENIAEELFEKVRDRFSDVSLGDDKAKATQNPEEARFFNFDYTVDGEPHGNVTISIIDEQALKVYFSKNISDELDGEHKQDWYKFLRELREFAKRHLLSFEPRDITRSTLQHRDIQQQSHADSTYSKEEVSEYAQSELTIKGSDKMSSQERHKAIMTMFPGARLSDATPGIYSVVKFPKTKDAVAVKLISNIRGVRELPMNEGWSGTKNRSYQKFAEVRIKVKHNKPILDDVHGARSRNISDTFVETKQGERFKLPFNNLTGARAMARHISAGGVPTDELGKHITEMVSEMTTLRPFVRGMQKRTFEDSMTQEMVESAHEYHGLLKDTLKKMKGKRGYMAYQESYKPALVEDDAEIPDLKELFVKKSLDERIEQALPLVHKAYNKMKTNKTTTEAHEFEKWATNLSEGTWALPETEEQVAKLAELMAEPLPVGVDAMDATTALYDIIGDDTFFNTLETVAKDDPTADARSYIATWLSDNMPDVLDQVVVKDEQEELSEEKTPMRRIMDFDNHALYWSNAGPLSKEYSELYDKLVPNEGKSDTIEGELLRAIGKIIYRHGNDGDNFSNGSYAFIEKMVGPIDNLDDMATKVIQYVLDKKGKYTPNPSFDWLDTADYGPGKYEDDWEMVDCESCGGSGENEGSEDEDGNIEYEECDSCDGTGERESTMYNEGFDPDEFDGEIKIPAVNQLRGERPTIIKYTAEVDKEQNTVRVTKCSDEKYRDECQADAEAEWDARDADVPMDEGNSPHKKGTKKYKKHMAAIHAEGEDQDEDENKEAVHDAILRRFQDNLDLVIKVGGPQETMDAIRDYVDSNDWDDLVEIGTSDVSAWVNNIVKDSEHTNKSKMMYEGRMKELHYDLENASDEEFEKNWNSKKSDWQEIKTKGLRQDPSKPAYIGKMKMHKELEETFQKHLAEGKLNESKTITEADVTTTVKDYWDGDLAQVLKNAGVRATVTRGSGSNGDVAYQIHSEVASQQEIQDALQNAQVPTGGLESTSDSELDQMHSAGVEESVTRIKEAFLKEAHEKLEALVGQKVYAKTKGQTGQVEKVSGTHRNSLVVNLDNGKTTVVHFTDLTSEGDKPGAVKRHIAKLRDLLDLDDNPVPNDGLPANSYDAMEEKMEEKMDEGMKEAVTPGQVAQAVRIANHMAGNYTDAAEAIEALHPGLTDHPTVATALKKANESMRETMNIFQGLMK
tara:strand:- start:3392 stop:6976 length:3585 start_codon:yes stop_codon:yes gene_type:complete